MKHVNLSVPGGQGLDGTGLVEMKRAELKKVEGGKLWFLTGLTGLILRLERISEFNTVHHM